MNEGWLPLRIERGHVMTRLSWLVVPLDFSRGAKGILMELHVRAEPGSNLRVTSETFFPTLCQICGAELHILYHRFIHYGNQSKSIVLINVKFCNDPCVINI